MQTSNHSVLSMTSAEKSYTGYLDEPQIGVPVSGWNFMMAPSEQEVTPIERRENISPFSHDDFKPHITIAYGSLPKGLKPPILTFETEVSEISPPRTEKESVWRIHSDEHENWLNVEPSAYEFDQPKGDPFRAYVYHSAPTEDRERIRAHGLIPSLPEHNPQWEHPDDATDGSEVRGQPEGVYVSRLPGDFQYTKPTDIWRARVNPDDLEHDPMWEEDEPGKHFVHWKAIPPQDIELHEPHESGGSWQMHPQANRAPTFETEPSAVSPPRESSWHFAMPAEEEWWNDRFPEGTQLWHGTDIQNLPSIMEHGLVPWDYHEIPKTPWAAQNSNLIPRPGHVYLAESPRAAEKAASDANARVDPILLAVNPRHLNPENINPDEDAYHQKLEQETNEDFDDPDDLDRRPMTLGEKAELHELGEEPQDTHFGIENTNTMAHRGIIPPHAITPYYRSQDMSWKPLPRRFWGAQSEDDLEPLYSSWKAGHIRSPYEAELLKFADSWTPKDQWPNALRERNGEPVDVDCTCKDGHKLDCPVHGMHPTLPTYDDTLDFPDPNNPAGYDYHADAPRTWMRAETKVGTAHHIDWNPGQWGKGFTTGNGSIHTWETNEADGYPTHAEYAEDMGIGQHGIGAPFEIHPKGIVRTFYGQPHDFPEIFAADPRLRPEPAGEQGEYEWHFGPITGSANKKLWVDDTRHPPDDSWDWARDVREAKRLTKKNGYKHMSLDHDLGILQYEGKVVINPDALSGGDFAIWLHEHRKHMPKSVNIHSHNSKGTKLMKEIFEKHTDVTTDRADDDLEEDWAREFKVHEPSEIEKEVVHLPEKVGLFHVAPTTERNRIRTWGLLPSDPLENYNYKWDPRQYAGEEPVPTGVYGWDNPQDAKEHAEYLEQFRGVPHDIWQFSDQGAVRDPDQDYSRAVYHRVQPELIEGPERFAKISSHQLAWLPRSGLAGKGLVTPNGDVHTWPTDADGYPHHAEYVDKRQPYQLNEGTAHFFKIRPRGGLDTESYDIPANIIHHILKTVPSLRPGEHTDWHFGADNVDTREISDFRMMPPMTQPPNATNPHPEARGCTCAEQDGKLFCPVHGLWPDPTQQGYDHSWSIPEGGGPVGYPESGPRNYYIKAEGSLPQVGHERNGQNKAQTNGSANQRSTAYSAYNGREGDEENSIGIDSHDPSIASCRCPNCLQQRERAWHLQGPGISGQGWTGLPRAEGAMLDSGAWQIPAATSHTSRLSI